jgi:SAM-dependent MidA family methyltransferase
MQQLKEIITEKIENSGPISFRDFMDMCLYYPGLGYYSSAGKKTGTKGDFLTSPYLSPVFGQLIALQLEEMWQQTGKGPFSIVEYGAGTGLLCYHILSHIRERPFFYNSIHYYIIEKRPPGNSEYEYRFPGKVTWCGETDIPGNIQGCILSNELLDNFPVHEVVMKEELQEVWVDYRDHEFREILQPADVKLANYFKELRIELPRGFRTEINDEATRWIQQIAQHLKKGFILTFDYGFPSSELYQPYRGAGNLVCYYQHTANICPYRHIGSQDITAQVNFSALHHWGSKYNLHLTGYTNQAYFLLGLMSRHISVMDKCRNDSPVLLHAFLRNLGRRIKVLIQQKGIPDCHLSGLQFPQRLS